VSHKTFLCIFLKRIRNFLLTFKFSLNSLSDKNSYKIVCMKKKTLLEKIEKEMDGLSTVITVPAGQTLCRENELAREAMLVVDGTAEVTRKGKPVAVIGPGELIGELALNNANHIRTATVATTTECTVMVMNPQEFATLKHSSEAFASLLQSTLDTRT
jgi:CRP/FNR family transcriptional regulator, cyclic AMP receptor protein